VPRCRRCGGTPRATGTEPHALAQADEGGPGDWVHAYLHRKEGDAGNASYWYRRAAKPVSRAPLAEEWAAITVALLATRV